MSDDSPRFHRQLAGLATDWVRAKRRSLERGRPNTKTDSGGTVSQYSFDGQELNRNELRKVRDIRKSGGIVASLFNKKALMRFGGGAELQSDNDDLEEWLTETYQRLDLIVLDLGLDATWFPYGLGEPAVETRSGEFSHVEFVEPWTTLPKTSEYGEILAWEQETQDGSTQVFDPEEIGSIVVNKAAARDKVGVSEVLRNEEEITQYKENQRAVDKAVEIAGFPHHVWTVGAEGRSPVDDNDLRRVRNLIDNMDGDTQFVVGPDVNHDKITPTDFDFQSITKRDLRILTTAIGLPFEVAGYGREGMGSGSETELIGKMHSLENQVARRRFETQFVEEFVRPVVEQYSPYDPDEHINLEISPFHDESEDVASLIEKIGDYMSNAEVRDRLDLPPLEDDDMAESYRPPQQIEEAEEGDEQQDPMGGLFGEAAEEAVDAALDTRDLEGGDSGNSKGAGFSNTRQLQIPDNAVSIDSPNEAPEGAQIVEGDQGGLYYVPGGGDGAGAEETTTDPDAAADAEAVESEVRDIVEGEGDTTDELRSHISEKTGVDDVTLQPLDSEEDTVQMASTLAYAGEQGLTDEVEEITFATGEEFGLYNFNDNRLEFNPNVSVEEDLAGSVEEGASVGEDMEWLVMHELGHANHHGELGDDMDEVGAVFDSGIAVSRDGEWVGRERIDMVDEQVSSYARSNPGEFVAEVFAGLALGQEFDDDVMEIYEEWDGPDTWQNYRGEN